LRERLQAFYEVLFGGTLAVNVFDFGESKQQIQYGFDALVPVRMFVPITL
jgi:hypothetical protein